MVDLISYPFRLNPRGHVVTTPDGEDYYAEELTMLIKTLPGERPLVPEYGVEDYTFQTVDAVELVDKVNLFGPPVKIEGVTSTNPKEGVMNINIKYEALTEEEYAELGPYADDYLQDLSDEDFFGDEAEAYGDDITVATDY